LRSGAFEVIGFLAATIVVGRLLNKYSWDRMGWHTQPGGLMPRLLPASASARSWRCWRSGSPSSSIGHGAAHR